MRLIDADALWERHCENCSAEVRESCKTDPVCATLTWVDEAPTIEPKQEWISVKDDLPKVTGRYLVYDESGNYYDAGFDADCGESGEFGEWRDMYDPYTLGVIDGEWITYGEITHWMPLPEPPERE